MLDCNEHIIYSARKLTSSTSGVARVLRALVQRHAMGPLVTKQPTTESKERRKLPSGVRGIAPAENEFSSF